RCSGSQEAKIRGVGRCCVYVCLLLVLFIIAGCGSQKPATHVTPPTTTPPQATQEAQNKSADVVARDMLDNIKKHGYNANPSVNNGLGGLWINWRYNSDPFQTNLNGSGFADNPGQNPPRHDQLT